MQFLQALVQGFRVVAVGVVVLVETVPAKGTRPQRPVPVLAGLDGPAGLEARHDGVLGSARGGKVEAGHNVGGRRATSGTVAAVVAAVLLGRAPLHEAVVAEDVVAALQQTKVLPLGRDVFQADAAHEGFFFGGRRGLPIRWIRTICTTAPIVSIEALIAVATVAVLVESTQWHRVAGLARRRRRRMPPPESPHVRRRRRAGSGTRRRGDSVPGQRSGTAARRRRRRFWSS